MLSWLSSLDRHMKLLLKQTSMIASMIVNRSQSETICKNWWSPEGLGECQSLDVHSAHNNKSPSNDMFIHARQSKVESYISHMIVMSKSR